MGKITTFSNTSDIVVNSDFWNKVNQMTSSYFSEISKVVIPEKPGSPEMELPWIYEIFQYCFADLMAGDLILLDGEMSGQLPYNLAIGIGLSNYPLYGSFITINDSDSMELIKQCCDNPYEHLEYDEVHIVTGLSSSENTEFLLSEAILRVLAADSIGKVIIDDTIDSSNKDVQILLGILYNLSIEVEYNPKNSNAFIDFITAS